MAWVLFIAPVYRSQTSRVFLFGSIAMCLSISGYVVYHHTLGLGRPHPTIACDESLIDLGAVESSAVLDREFVIWNRGNRPLLISKVHSGCGECVHVTGFTKSPISPGLSGFVHVQLFGKSIKSQQVKGVTVDSNDPRHPRLTLLLSARPSE